MVISILIFLLMFGVLVISHEMGHFLIGKKSGIRVKEFTVGMGPVLFKTEKGETTYSIRLLPFGGACIFDGEDGVEAADGVVDEHLFQSVPVWSRIATLFAGPFFNFVLAFICALIVVSFSGTDLPEIHEVMEGSAAEEVGMQPGDKIVKIDGMKIHLYREVSLNSVMNMDGSSMNLTYERNGQQYDVVLTPKYSEEDARYYMGFAGGTYIECNFLQTLKYSVYEIQYWMRYTVKSLGMLISGKIGVDSLSGPVGMAEFVGDTYEEVKPYGISSVLLTMLNLMTLLSVNLGIMNLLPLPALDGGRLVFQFVEVVRGKPVPPEKEGFVHMAGLVAFMILMVVVMYNDIMRILK